MFIIFDLSLAFSTADHELLVMQSCDPAGIHRTTGVWLSLFLEVQFQGAMVGSIP